MEASILYHTHEEQSTNRVSEPFFGFSGFKMVAKRCARQFRPIKWCAPSPRDPNHDMIVWPNPIAWPAFWSKKGRSRNWVWSKNHIVVWVSRWRRAPLYGSKFSCASFGDHFEAGKPNKKGRKLDLLICFCFWYKIEASRCLSTLKMMAETSFTPFVSSPTPNTTLLQVFNDKTNVWNTFHARRAFLSETSYASEYLTPEMGYWSVWVNKRYIAKLSLSLISLDSLRLAYHWLALLCLA